MSLCTICGAVQCEHTPEERGQTFDEAMRNINSDELAVLKAEPHGSQKLIELAKQNAHLPIPASIWP